MPRKNRIKYSPAAVDDMDEIFSYISHDTAANALTLLKKLDTEISVLKEFPNLGSILSDDEYPFVMPGYRFIVVHPYLVFYKLDGNTVIIYRILHGRRDYLRELFSPQ